MKYTTNLTPLNKDMTPDKVKCLEVLTLDNDIKISFAYKLKARKPYAYVATYKDKTVILSINMQESFEDFIDRFTAFFGGFEATTQAIIERYNQLNIIQK